MDMRELLAQIAGDNAALAADPERVAQLRRWYSQIGAATTEKPELADPETFRRFQSNRQFQANSTETHPSPSQELGAGDPAYRGWV